MLDTLKSNLLHNVDSNLRVIILSANGGVFSSGHDLKELVRWFKICNKQIAFLGWWYEQGGNAALKYNLIYL